MGPVTVTAARIYKGEKQLAAQPGSLVSPERANLSMQLLPYAARIKTFSLDGQTTDSAPSMAAYMTGVKMRNEVISMSADTVAVDGAGKQYVSGETAPAPTNGTPAQTLLELAKAKGRAVGAVSTTRVGHATPATTYAHVCNRNGYNTIARTIDAGPCELQHPAWRRHRRAAGRRTAQLPAQAAQPGQQAHRRRQSGDGLPGQGYTYVDTGCAR